MASRGAIKSADTGVHEIQKIQNKQAVLRLITATTLLMVRLTKQLVKVLLSVNLWY